MAGEPKQQRFASGMTAFTDVTLTGKGGTSDDQINKLKDFVALMGEGNLGFLYKRWVEHPCADPGQKGKWQSQSVWNSDDQRDLDSLRGINISSIDDTKMRLNQASFATGSLGDLGTSLGQSVDGAWNSRNSAKAVEKFTDLEKASKNAVDVINGIHGSVDGLVKSVSAVTGKIGDFWDSVCKKGSGIIDQQGWLGNDGSDAGDERGSRSGFIDRIDNTLKYGCRNRGSKTWYPASSEFPAKPGVENDLPAGPDLAAKIRTPAFLDLSGDGPFPGTHWSNDVCNQMDKMCADYYAAIVGFRGLMKDAHTSLDKAFSTFNSQLKSVDADPFGKLVAPGDAPPAAPPPRQETPSPERHSPPPRSGGPSATAPAQAAPSHSGQPTQPPPQPPNVQPPNVQPPSVPQQSPAPTPPSLATPAAAGDVPRRADLPQHAKPAAQDHQETVKVKGAGGGTIEMSSPDGRGHMKLSVDDGSGKPKSYDVDFGDGMGVAGQDAGQSPGKHAMDQTGATQQSGGQHAVGGQGLGRASAEGAVANHGAHISPVQDPRDGLDGATGQAGVHGSPQHVQADHSGHAVIHDGDNTITIDKGASDSGEVKVTIDDGAGKPTSYTMDTGAATGIGSSDQPSAPATDQPSAPATDQPGAPAHAASMAQHGNADLGVPQQAHSGADLGAQHSGAVSQPQPGNVDGGNFDAAAAPAGGAPGGMGPAGDTPPVNHTATTSTANVQAGVASVAGDAGADASGASAFTGAGADSGAGVGAGVAGEPAQPGAVSGADPTMGAAGQHGMGQHGGAPGVADAGGTHAPAGAGGPGVAGPAGGADHGGAAEGAGGGMPMMGGMGGAGGGGGDSERGASVWRTQGDLFSDVGDAVIDRIEDLLDGHERR